jgi:hypothetical protein
MQASLQGFVKFENRARWLESSAGWLASDVWDSRRCVWFGKEDLSPKRSPAGPGLSQRAILKDVFTVRGGEGIAQENSD